MEFHVGKAPFFARKPESRRLARAKDAGRVRTLGSQCVILAERVDELHPFDTLADAVNILHF